LRKSLIAAFAALFLIGVSAVAYAQYAPPSHTQSGTITTTKSTGNTRIVTELKTGANDQSTVSNFTFLFPKELKISTKGFKFCPVNTIVKAGNVDSKCPRGSKVGFGTAAAFVGSRKGSNIGFDTTIYAGTKSSLTIYLVGKGDFSTIKRAFPAVIKSASGSFKQALSVDIPKDIQFVGGVTPVVLSQVKISLKAAAGRNYIATRVPKGSCPKNKQHLLGTKLTYSRPVATPALTSSATTTAKCK
jgi:hypothetical protein